MALAHLIVFVIGVSVCQVIRSVRQVTVDSELAEMDALKGASKQCRIWSEKSNFEVLMPGVPAKKCMVSCLSNMRELHTKVMPNKFSEEFGDVATECACKLQAAGNDAAFTFTKPSSEKCTREMCWKNYVQLADAGKKQELKISGVNTLSAKCGKCEGTLCDGSYSLDKIDSSPGQKKLLEVNGKNGKSKAAREQNDALKNVVVGQALQKDSKDPTLRVVEKKGGGEKVADSTTPESDSGPDQSSPEEKEKEETTTAETKGEEEKVADSTKPESDSGPDQSSPEVKEKEETTTDGVNDDDVVAIPQEVSDVIDNNIIVEVLEMLDQKPVPDSNITTKVDQTANVFKLGDDCIDSPKRIGSVAKGVADSKCSPFKMVSGKEAPGIGAMLDPEAGLCLSLVIPADGDPDMVLDKLVLLDCGLDGEMADWYDDSGKKYSAMQKWWENPADKSEICVAHHQCIKISGQ